MRMSVRLRRRWRMISCPAAKQMKAVKPSIATDRSSWTYSAIASFKERRLSTIETSFCVQCLLLHVAFPFRCGLRSSWLAPSDVEKRGLALALQNDVKAVDNAGPFLLECCEQRGASMLRNRQQDGISGIGWLVGKVQACQQVVEQSACEHGDADVWCLPSLVIEGNGAGLDRLKPVEALVLGARATKAHKGRIQRCWSRICRMVVAAMGIGLPDLDQRIGNRQPVAIEDASFDGNARVQWVVGKVHLRHQAREQSGTGHREMDMGWSPGIRVIEPGIGSRANGQKAIHPLVIGHTTTHAQEVWIDRPRPLIAFVQVAASSVGLPYLEQRMRHRSSTLVEHTARHNDALPDRLASSSGVTCEVGVLRGDGTDGGSGSGQP